MNMKAEILALLRETEVYLSGQELCEKFAVSRTAIWKVMRQLKEEGYVIEAVQNKGYRLLEEPDLLTSSALAGSFRGMWAGSSIVYREETGSTNIDARKLAEEGAPHGTVAIAGRQLAGKGRRGRGWVSPPGDNLYFTILLRPSIESSKAPKLTLVMALSVAEAIQDKYKADIQIKWPNDVLCAKKKVCGILTEMSVESDYIQYVLIGVGINTNQKAFPEEIREKATSLCNELGIGLSRSELLKEVLTRFQSRYDQFVSDGTLEHMKEEYHRFLVNRGNAVKILDPKGEWYGKALGINEEGELLVEENGVIRTVYAGEVSVRGIDSYV